MTKDSRDAVLSTRLVLTWDVDWPRSVPAGQVPGLRCTLAGLADLSLGPLAHERAVGFQQQEHRCAEGVPRQSGACMSIMGVLTRCQSKPSWKRFGRATTCPIAMASLAAWFDSIV